MKPFVNNKLGRNKFSVRRSWLEKIGEKSIPVALNVLYAKKNNISNS